MRIVEIIPHLSVGGAEKFTVDISNAFVKQGHEVILIVTNSLDKYGDFLKFVDKSVRIIGLNKRHGIDLRLFFQLTKLIKNLNPDIVHTHLNAIIYNLLTPFFCKKSGYVHTIHNSAEKEAHTSGKLGVYARKLMFRFGRTVPVSISEESLASFYEFYGIDKHSELILNGVSKIEVDKNRATEISDRDVNIVNVARVMPQKNQKMLVEAIRNLNDRGKNINLYIIGDNSTPEAEEIEGMELPYVHLLGKKENPRDYIAKADAFVLSSIYEGMPLSLIECFSVGTIPLATPVGGIKNMICDGENGILFKDVSVKSIEDGIIKFTNLSDSDRETLKGNSYKSFDKYELSNCVYSYLKLFKKIKG